MEGKHDEVWESALQLDAQRKSKGKKMVSSTPNKKQYADVDHFSKSDMEKRYKRARSLTNDGEFSKAFGAVVERGKAPLNAKVLRELKRKNPSRINPVSWPTEEKLEKSEGESG